MSDFIDAETLSVGTEKQLIELNKMIVSLRTRISELENELNARDRLPLPKSVIQQIVELEAIVRKQQDDLKYYKNYVPQVVIESRENKNKPTRGSFSQTIKKNK